MSLSENNKDDDSKIYDRQSMAPIFLIKKPVGVPF